MKILIPVDFSPTSHNAIEYAYEMANKLKVEIELLHIISKRKNFDSVVEEELEIQRLENEMTKFSRRYPNKDTEVLNVQITTLVKIGKIEEVISSVCEKNKIDLIILGTKAKHSILEYLFGSFSSLLIQTAPRPMIIVPELAEIKPIQHIAVATDEEERDQVIFLFVKALSHNWEQK